MAHFTTPRQFYVYVLLRPDGRPFYVGKGAGGRVNNHEVEARGDCSCHKCRVIRKIWRNGGSVVKSIVFTTEKEEEAYQQEARLIDDLWGDIVNVRRGLPEWHGKRRRQLLPGNLLGWRHVFASHRATPADMQRLVREAMQRELDSLEANRHWRKRRRLTEKDRAAQDAEYDALIIALYPHMLEQHQLPLDILK